MSSILSSFTIYWYIGSYIRILKLCLMLCTFVSLRFNPIIYSFRGKKFKDGLKRMIPCSGSTTAEANLCGIEMAAIRAEAGNSDDQVLQETGFQNFSCLLFPGDFLRKF